MKYRTLFTSLAAIMMIAAHGAPAHLNISLTASQFTIGGVVVDSATTPAQVQKIMGGSKRQYVPGGRGFWYRYNADGLSFRWSADSSRLTYICINFTGYEHKPYMAGNKYNDTFSCEGRAMNTYTCMWTVLKSSAKNVITIRPGMTALRLQVGRYRLDADYTLSECYNDEGRVFACHQIMQRCIISLRGHDRPAKPLMATCVKNSLYIGGRPAPDSLYADTYILPEDSACGEADIAEIGRKDTLIRAFYEWPQDSLSLDNRANTYATVLKEQGGTIKDRYFTEKFTEGRINSDAYYMLKNGAYRAALALFKLNTILHPASSNVWDSYAEGFLNCGQPLMALEMYRKSAALNQTKTLDDKDLLYSTQANIRLIMGE